jgi:hypothetical protein
LEALDGEGDEVLPGFPPSSTWTAPSSSPRPWRSWRGPRPSCRLPRTRYEELKELAEEHEAYRLAEAGVEEAREAYERTRGEAARLAEELEDLFGGENPERAQRELREEEEKLREVAAMHRGRAHADEREAQNVDKAREAIDSGAEEHCPHLSQGLRER